MVNSPESRTNKCFKCSSGLLMLDGSCWCSIDMKPHKECPYNFEPGNAKLYKLVPQTITPKQEARKIKVKEVKPKEVKQKTVTKSSRKIKPEAPRLF